MTWDPERETGVPCPKCNGKGEVVLSHVEHADGSYAIRKQACDVCSGAGVVSVSRMRAWRVANWIDPSDR